MALLGAFGLGLLMLGAHVALGAEDAAGEPPAAVTLPGGAVLPDDGTRWCGGHVTGAPGKGGGPGAHLSWDLYTTGVEVSTLTERYVEALGRMPDLQDGNCSTWRFPPEEPREILEVCAAAAPGPWSECDPIPDGTQSVIMGSSLARSD